jgi:hypothetical protein
MATLAIVWRNREKVNNRVRFSRQNEINGRRTYVVEQLVSTQCDVWAEITVLQIDSKRPANGNVVESARVGVSDLGQKARWPRSIFPLFVG